MVDLTVRSWPASRACSADTVAAVAAAMADKKETARMKNYTL